MKRTQNRINKTRNDSWEDKNGDIHELGGLTNNPVHPRPSKGKKKKRKGNMLEKALHAARINARNHEKGLPLRRGRCKQKLVV